MGYATVSMCSMAVFRGGHLWDPPLCPVSPTLHNITLALWNNGAYTTSLSENAFLHSLSSGRGGAPFTKLFLRNLSWLLLWCPPFPSPRHLHHSASLPTFLSALFLVHGWSCQGSSIFFKAHPVLTKLAVKCLILSITDNVIFLWPCIPTTYSITPEGF